MSASASIQLVGNHQDTNGELVYHKDRNQRQVQEVLATVGEDAKEWKRHDYHFGDESVAPDSPFLPADQLNNTARTTEMRLKRRSQIIMNP